MNKWDMNILSVKHLAESGAYAHSSRILESTRELIKMPVPSFAIPHQICGSTKGY